MRIGLGYDVHAFQEGRRLVLGGVEIPGETGLAGHSDADVLLHAVADAVLGAARLGDLGLHFPPGDERWAGADSGAILAECARMARQAGFEIGNVDATVVAERPRLAEHLERMEETIAALLGVRALQVNVKATTNEGLGAVGRGEGIAALAVALLRELPRPVD